MSVGPASRPRRNRRRSHAVKGNEQRPSRPATGGDAPAPSRTAETQVAIDEHVWEREMMGLRRISLLLTVTLVAVVARMVIDGPKPLSGLTGALILVLLVCSLRLRQQGRRLHPDAPSETERVDDR